MRDYIERAELCSPRGAIRAAIPVKLPPLHEIAAPSVTTLPADLVESIAKEFYDRNESLEHWDADQRARDWIKAEVREFKKNRLDVAFSEGEIDIEAEKWVAICKSLVNYESCAPYVNALGVRIPEIKNNITAVGLYKRFVSKKWWRCQFRKLFTREAESHLRGIGIVQRKKQLYASDRAVDWRRVRKLRDRSLLQEMIATSDAGDQLELWGVVEKSNANPAIRRAELMTRLRGFEDIADKEGHVADFYTLTTPSAFHRTLTDGTPNPLWKGFTIREGQAWLCKNWARVRAKIKRRSILIYGFRIAEPHHDGTQHWHVVMFYPAQHRDVVRTIIREVWLSEYGDEVGARSVRTKVKAIDRAKGSACGYVSKYIAKNIDGFDVGNDHESEGQATKATDSVSRVAAWASTNSIRQFQQVGGPQVSLYRELRRLRSACGVSEIEACRVAADEGDFAGFITAVGGITVGRHTTTTLDTEISGELTQYSELRGPQVVGVRCKRGRVKTRCKVWRIELKGLAKIVPTSGKDLKRSEGGSRSSASSSLGPVSITVRYAGFMPSLEKIGKLAEPSGRYAWIETVPFKRSRGDPPRLN